MVTHDTGQWLDRSQTDVTVNTDVPLSLSCIGGVDGGDADGSGEGALWGEHGAGGTTTHDTVINSCIQAALAEL